MNIENRKLKAINHLQSLLNIGPATAKRLYSIGITSPKHLKKSNPEKIYERLKKAEGGVLDKCVLYQLRGAILNIQWWACKNFPQENLNTNRRR